MTEQTTSEDFTLIVHRQMEQVWGTMGKGDGKLPFGGEHRLLGVWYEGENFVCRVRLPVCVRVDAEFTGDAEWQGWVAIDLVGELTNRGMPRAYLTHAFAETVTVNRFIAEYFPGLDVVRSRGNTYVYDIGRGDHGADLPSHLIIEVTLASVRRRKLALLTE